jgi:hypothetical protein
MIMTFFFFGKTTDKNMNNIANSEADLTPKVQLLVLNHPAFGDVLGGDNIAKQPVLYEGTWFE